MVTEHGGLHSADDNTNPIAVAEQTTQTVEDPLSERIEKIEKTQATILDRLQTLENLYYEHIHVQAHTCTYSDAQVPALPTSNSLAHSSANSALVQTPDWLDPFELFNLTPPALSPRLLSPTPPPLPPPYPPSNHPTHQHSAVPCSLKSRGKYALASSEIDNTTLKSVCDVLKQNPELRTESGCGTLAQRLAKEALFGEEVMKRCTPNGSKKYPALPQEELYNLKHIVFNELKIFHHQPGDFEPVWQKRCMVAIEQACNRLRKNT